MPISTALTSLSYRRRRRPPGAWACRPRLPGEVSIPIPHDGAVCFEGQAQFHPLKFLKVLADQLTIYEQSRVLTAEGTS